LRLAEEVLVIPETFVPKWDATLHFSHFHLDFHARFQLIL